MDHRYNYQDSSVADDDEPEPYRLAVDGSPACARCGGPTISSIKVEDICLDGACGHHGYVHMGTIFDR